MPDKIFDIESLYLSTTYSGLKFVELLFELIYDLLFLLKLTACLDEIFLLYP